MVEADHQLIRGLMAKPISELFPRLALMRLELLSYPVLLELKHKPGTDIILADVLSRTCLQGADLSEDLSCDPLKQVCTVLIKDEVVLRKYQLASELDRELITVMRYIQNGWPVSRKLCVSDALPYYNL